MDWEEDEEENGSFEEYIVEMSIMRDTNIFDKPVRIAVWAQGFNKALICGEVLSAVYLA
jgi:hypothetical protein